MCVEAWKVIVAMCLSLKIVINFQIVEQSPALVVIFMLYDFVACGILGFILYSFWRILDITNYILYHYNIFKLHVRIFRTLFGNH